MAVLFYGDVRQAWVGLLNIISTETEPLRFIEISYWSPKTIQNVCMVEGLDPIRIPKGMLYAEVRRLVDAGGDLDQILLIAGIVTYRNWSMVTESDISRCASFYGGSLSDDLEESLERILSQQACIADDLMEAGWIFMLNNGQCILEYICNYRSSLDHNTNCPVVSPTPRRPPTRSIVRELEMCVFKMEELDVNSNVPFHLKPSFKRVNHIHIPPLELGRPRLITPKPTHCQSNPMESIAEEDPEDVDQT